MYAEERSCTIEDLSNSDEDLEKKFGRQADKNENTDRTLKVDSTALGNGYRQAASGRKDPKINSSWAKRLI